MKSIQSLPVDAAVARRLALHLRDNGGPPDMADVVATAITFWLDDQARQASGAEPPIQHGYQWKSLFLPEGTVLRSWCNRENSYARVVGDQIIYLGRAVSPNQFAQSFADTTRNAWTDLSVQRPGEKRFTLAARLRRDLAEQAAAAAQAKLAAQFDKAAQAGQAAQSGQAARSSQTAQAARADPVGDAQAARVDPVGDVQAARVDPVGEAQAARADPVGEALAVLLAHIAAAIRPIAAPLAAPSATSPAHAPGHAPAPAPPPTPAPARGATACPGWDLPERRQFRYRLEDVAY